MEKLENITIHAAYPENWYDFGSLSLDGLSYYECRKAIADFNQKREQGLVNSQVDRELWPDIQAVEAMVRSGELLEIARDVVPDVQ